MGWELAWEQLNLGCGLRPNPDWTQCRELIPEDKNCHLWIPLLWSHPGTSPRPLPDRRWALRPCVLALLRDELQAKWWIHTTYHMPFPATWNSSFHSLICLQTKRQICGACYEPEQTRMWRVIACCLAMLIWLTALGRSIINLFQRSSEAWLCTEIG